MRKSGFSGIIGRRQATLNVLLTGIGGGSADDKDKVEAAHRFLDLLERVARHLRNAATQKPFDAKPATRITQVSLHDATVRAELTVSPGDEVAGILRATAEFDYDIHGASAKQDREAGLDYEVQLFGDGKTLYDVRWRVRSKEAWELNLHPNGRQVVRPVVVHLDLRRQKLPKAWRQKLRRTEATASLRVPLDGQGVRLHKAFFLGWCTECAVPLLRSTHCSQCHAKAGQFRLPEGRGEVRPVFDDELVRLAEHLRSLGCEKDLRPRKGRYPLMLDYDNDGCEGIRVRSLLGDGIEVVRIEWPRTDQEKVTWHPDAQPRYFELESLLQPNREALGRLVADAKRVLRSGLEEGPSALTFSFSGGRDSVVLLHLLANEPELLSHPNLLLRFLWYSQSVLDVPHEAEFVRNIVEKYGLESRFVEGQDPSESLAALMAERAAPRRNDLWCCRYNDARIARTLDLVRANNGVPPEQVIYSFVGDRGYEEPEHRPYAGWTEPYKVVGQLIVQPLLRWGMLASWLYIVEHGLQVHPMYLQGFTRTEHLLCPKNPATERGLTRIYYPRYAKEAGM